jgi:hypothetical protein
MLCACMGHGLASSYITWFYKLWRSKQRRLQVRSPEARRGVVRHGWTSARKSHGITWQKDGHNMTATPCLLCSRGTDVRLAVGQWERSVTHRIKHSMTLEPSCKYPAADVFIALHRPYLESRLQMSAICLQSLIDLCWLPLCKCIQVTMPSSELLMENALKCGHALQNSPNLFLASSSTVPQHK